MKNTGFFWHVHHDVLLEYCYDYKGRVAFIEEVKSKAQIEIRLRLFKPVKNVHRWIKKAWEKDHVDFTYDLMDGKYKKIIEAQHKKECPDCSWNGKTIFPKRG